MSLSNRCDCRGDAVDPPCESYVEGEGYRFVRVSEVDRATLRR
jgi:hypothetical protein